MIEGGSNKNEMMSENEGKKNKMTWKIG